MPRSDGKSGALLGQVVTANRLTDGVVLYRTPAGGWSDRLADGEIVAGKEAGAARLAEAEAAVKDCRVVAPYLIDVVADADAVGIRPQRFREAVRAAGPTVAADFRAAVARPIERSVGPQSH